MTVINDPDTRSALREIGCLVEDTLDTAAFAKLLAQRLEADHIAGGLDDVPAVEVAIGQLVTAITGRSDEQLVELVKPLLGTGADSRVQKALTNGYLLCGKRAKIEVDIEGDRKFVSVATRFLSADHDVLQRYVLQPRQDRANSFVKSTLELTALVEERQPEMAPRVGTFIEQLNITWQKALTPPSAA
jgi:hypothetical protein